MIEVKNISRKKTYKALGLMSGSSLDGVDIAYCTFTLEQGELENWELLLADTIPFPEQWVARLAHLPEQNALTFAKTHVYFGHFLADKINDFVKKHEISPDFIASHGHTIFHDPDKRFTVQVGDGAAIAAKTGFPVINDFRTQDIAIDGEGTPLAPAADRYLFPGFDFYMNIGGISNITFQENNRYVAFDICPANQMLNFLAAEVGKAYDKDGEMAQSGQTIEALVKKLSDFDYYEKKYPKSLGNCWIKRSVLPIFQKFEGSIEDKLNSAVKFIATQTALAVQDIYKQEKLAPKNRTLFVTGGGALNGYLIEAIDQALTEHGVPLDIFLPPEEVIDFKEAALMALLGVLRLENKPNCFASVTGAQRDTIGGVVHQGHLKFV